MAPTQAFGPLTFAPGEAYQFDWAEDWIVLDGVTTKVQVAHVRLCHSRMPFVQVYPRQTQAQRIRCGFLMPTHRRSPSMEACASAGSTTT